ncbi:hypothetical protein NEOLEDRAFT_535949 [Neolentinus lepideus HHB14362 ss-1]|uniref:F-box domain-containing protein n=1 Tax=Neolentinus lepideus HHB14362 ss-1 TaxID=1314782 RepID=A0A165RAN2_9AGAM|nr:hypothetical protein NEOLEDRAFT_535949 [Neolentinus lepideus HHB14362 ss-1]
MVYPDSWLIPPQRRRGNNTLVVVPHDIWSNIVENFRPSPDLTFRESREDLTSLSLTCRYFCVITRPLLFEEMVFVGGSKNPGVAVRDFTGWFYEAGKKEPGSLGAFVKTSLSSMNIIHKT